MEHADTHRPSTERHRIGWGLTRRGGRLHDHHPLPPLCGAPKLFAQGAGDRDESRISRAKVYRTTRNYHHTSDPGSQRKIITVFVFYLQGKITEC